MICCVLIEKTTFEICINMFACNWQNFVYHLHYNYDALFNLKIVTYTFFIAVLYKLYDNFCIKCIELIKRVIETFPLFSDMIIYLK